MVESPSYLRKPSSPAAEINPADQDITMTSVLEQAIRLDVEA